MKFIVIIQLISKSNTKVIIAEQSVLFQIEKIV